MDRRQSMGLAKFAVIAAFACAAGISEARSFTNDIALPSRMYMLSGERNEMFVKPIIKRWRPYDDFVRFSLPYGRGKFLRHLSHVATLDNPQDGTQMTVSLINGDEFETVKQVRTTLCVGESGKGDKDVHAQIVGDSFTHGSFFRWALLESKHVPKLHLVGLRSCGKDQYDEGRGGWRLESYFTVPKGDRVSYHGFMHPADGRYWGNRSFWKTAWRCVRNTQPEGFEPRYSCARFGRCVKRFDEQTGILLDPKAGDVQYDPALKSMVRYDGTEWRPVDEKKLKWTFDYGKYLSMWNLEKPKFLFELLGLNDFGGGSLTADFGKFAERLEAFRDSYLKAVPDGKFVVCIPCSSCGTDNNKAGVFLTFWNAKMWRFRDWLIKRYGDREHEGWYLLDVSIATDNDYGFSLCDEKDAPSLTLPHLGYRRPEKERIRVQSGTPHPYGSYPAMGVPIAAFIQYWRDR